jgi:hypothetical protein
MMTATGWISMPAMRPQATCARRFDSVVALAAAARLSRTAWNRKVPDPQAGSMTRSVRGFLITLRQIFAASQSGV